MNRTSLTCILALVTALTIQTRAWAKGEWFENWEMEDRVAQSQLILVARVSNVSAMTVVHGGKASSTLREYRFQPVRRLKGVFSRDELALTSSDLGVPEDDGSTVPPLRQGEFRLLLLARTAEGFSCVSGARGGPVEQQVPKLAGPDDHVVAMTERLVQITELPSRKARTELLIGRLAGSSGPSAVPLLRSVARRAIWAAQTPACAEPLARLAHDKSPPVRTAALYAIDRILAADYLRDDNKMLGQYAEALRQAAELDQAETAARVPTLRAVGHLGEFGRRLPWTAKLLSGQLDEAPTYAERQAAAAALADLNDPKTAELVLRALAQLPLDELPERKQVLARAAVRLAGGDALPALVQRVRRTLAAGESPLVEAAQLGLLKSREAIPALLEAAGMSPAAALAASGGDDIAELQESTHQEQLVLAEAFEQIKDERAVAVLAAWLRSPYLQVREACVKALDAIDSDSAVAALRLRIKPEPHLPLKLRMAATLGRHDIKDGYSFAIEHVADPGLTELAAGALAAIRDDRTREELWKILETSHDRNWNAAALAGLAAVRDVKVKPRLFEVLRNPRDPLLAGAAAAAGDLGDREALPLLAPLAASRNAQVAQAALRSIARLTSGGQPAAGKAATREAAIAVFALLHDGDAEIHFRLAAFEALRGMQDERLLPSLRTLADQAELENTPLLQAVEQELHSAKASLPGEV